MKWIIANRMAYKMSSPGSHIKDELEFGVRAIKSNPKSYGAWYQRRWLLSSIKTIEPAFDVTPELLLCNRLLEMDARNCKNIIIGEWMRRTPG